MQKKKKKRKQRKLRKLKAKAYKTPTRCQKKVTQTFLCRHQNRSLSANWRGETRGRLENAVNSWFLFWLPPPPPTMPSWSTLPTNQVDPFRQIPLSWWLKLIIARVLLLLVLAGCSMLWPVVQGGYTHAASFHNSFLAVPTLFPHPVVCIFLTRLRLHPTCY